MSSEVSGQAEPAARASVETTPAPEPLPMLSVTPTRNSSMAGEPAPSVASRVAAQAATPVEKTAPSRPAIPEAHRRFAGTGFFADLRRFGDFALAAMARRRDGCARSHARIRWVTRACAARDASPERERWVPTSIAPSLTSERPQARDDQPDVFLRTARGAVPRARLLEG
jgi:hypothetical protein